MVPVQGEVAMGEDGLFGLGQEVVVPDQADADVGHHQLADAPHGVAQEHPGLEIADGDGEVGLDHGAALAGVAVHAAVDVHTDDVGFALVDGLDRLVKQAPDRAVEPRAQQAVHQDVIAG